MSRVARVVAPGVGHHITQRGNRQADIFKDDEDYESYLHLLRKYAELHGLRIWAYCLMTNHVHLVAVPEREESLGLTLRDTHTVYAMHFNERTGESGHVWQGRFYSCPLDESHLWAAVRYIERNPIRAGLVERAEEYAWSSAAAHCGLCHDPLLAGNFPPSGVIENWSEWLRGEDDAESVERLRCQTLTGRPCGAESFVNHLEALLDRFLRPQKRGRKFKIPPLSQTEPKNNEIQFNS